MRPGALCAGWWLAFCLLLAACSSEPDYSDPLPAPSPALWEVTGENGQHGYLFGTIHALPGGIEWRTQPFDAAFAKADQLVVEVDLPAASSRMGGVFERLAESPGLVPITERVDPSYRRPLERLLKAKGLRIAGLSTMESWAAALTLAQAYQTGSAANGVDNFLLQNAAGKPIVELEGLEHQLGLFDALPEAEQSDLLEAVVGELDRTGVDELADTRMRVWLAGDTKGLAEELDQGLLADPELREALLVRRNRAWAQRTEQLLQSGKRPFVAVGAAHLVGPEGLPALLTARGYAVKRIQ